MFMALQREDRYPITDIFDQTPAIPEACQWAIFLRNHDELTLEMVTDEERDFMYSVYAKDPKAKINLGIRHRLAPLMENDRRRIELMNSLLFSLPGTPVIYYGDEIGMGDNVYLGDRDGVRTPMQWSPDRNAGFSATNPQRLYLPVILDPQYHYESVNVETQRSNTTSLFWFMKRIINMRKKFKAFSRGDMKFLQVDNPKILAFTRSFENQTLLIIANLSKHAQPAEIDLKELRGYVPVEAFSQNKFPPVKEGTPYFFTLSPHAFQWFSLQGPKTETIALKPLPQLKVDQWESLFTGDVALELQNTVLPAYLQRMPWFTGKNKILLSTAIAAHTALPVGEDDAEILLVEATFESGLPEYYSLPLLFQTTAEGKLTSDDYPNAVVAQLSIGGLEGMLCDAVYIARFQQSLLRFMAAGKHFMARGEVAFSGTEAVQKFLTGNAEHILKVRDTSEMHTAITYNNEYFLKIYRRVDKGLHPDVELTRYLAENAPGLTTKYAGGIVWHLAEGAYHLALLETLEESYGNGHRYMLDRITNYLERIQARDRAVLAAYSPGSALTTPVSFDALSDEVKEFVGANAAEKARLAGLRLAQVHKVLAAGTEREFIPEEFSLHYQRSLFSSMLSLVREMGQAVQKKSASLPDGLRNEVTDLNNRRDEILATLKKVYSKKFDVLKIRSHGNLGLSHLLLTGKDVLIHDFGGNPLQPFSERRLKRSPLRDIAAMIRSFYYVAYEGFLTSHQLPAEGQAELLPFAGFWAHYMSNFFMKAYLDETKGSGFIPDDKADFEILLKSLLLENALQWFNYEMAHRPERVVIPLRIIQTVME
jgi:maltose alpha-D-glucosyltransferase/alpha-amylase